MTPDERARILTQSRSFAEQAYRVLGVAMRDVAHQPEHIEVETVEHDLTFLGLVAMMDPPHREVPAAIAACRNAGVRTLMITGDHPLTAWAIARKIGLVPDQAAAHPSGFVPVIEGMQLDRMSDDHLRQLLTPSRSGEPDPVFARMAPRHKMRVVSMLKDQDEVVAVTARSKGKDRGVDLKSLRWVDDPLTLARDPGIDVFVELMGGDGDPAKAAIEAALGLPRAGLLSVFDRIGVKEMFIDSAAAATVQPDAMR